MQLSVLLLTDWLPQWLHINESIQANASKTRTNHIHINCQLGANKFILMFPVAHQDKIDVCINYGCISRNRWTHYIFQSSPLHPIAGFTLLLFWRIYVTHTTSMKPVNTEGGREDGDSPHSGLWERRREALIVVKMSLTLVCSLIMMFNSYHSMLYQSLFSWHFEVFVSGFP